MDADQEMKPIGAPPETLILSGVRRAEHTRMKWTCYDADSCATIVELNELSELPKEEELDPNKRYWLDMAGLHDGPLVGEICQHFSINKMVGEDIMNTLSLSKVEEFDNFIYLSQKVPFQDNEGNLEVHQLSFVVLEHVLISFTEVDSDFFSPIYKRMKVPGSRMSKKGSDYLAWALMDLGMDQTLSYITQLELGLENVEAMIINSKSLPALPDVHVARSEVTTLYRAMRPLKEWCSI